ncbi:tRNA nucleotidyltransferase/poly(A) polymerase [Pseudomonas syringae pv. actinidiae]|uniref:tRNA nucleotidyltransferase/poly(A) polymerase n=1 Tax=Pseudomonas syringae pv. actinidiae TaxID=103796 RepID=A0A2V0QHR4_PSESF|nr:tRNA nucleotidyltransferase/poly(A) polymerase [Pseudomonas syringae pv. actinidiae]
MACAHGMYGPDVLRVALTLHGLHEARERRALHAVHVLHEAHALRAVRVLHVLRGVHALHEACALRHDGCCGRGFVDDRCDALRYGPGAVRQQVFQPPPVQQQALPWSRTG